MEKKIGQRSKILKKLKKGLYILYPNGHIHKIWDYTIRDDLMGFYYTIGPANTFGTNTEYSIHFHDSDIPILLEELTPAVGILYGT